MFIVFPIIALLIFSIMSILIVKAFKSGSSKTEIAVAVLYIFSFISFAIAISDHANPYYEAIDPVDMGCYSPFSADDWPSLMSFYLLAQLSLVLIWIKGHLLAPLTRSLCLIFILIGLLINLGVFMQISTHNTQDIHFYHSGSEPFVFAAMPLFNTILGLYFIYKTCLEVTEEASTKNYTNKSLNRLNIFLASRSQNPAWLVLLMFPVFFLVSLILMLFGQEPDALTKVFTDTTTWHFSQKTHPPILNHTGHYLCTVAASGSPKIVKPIRIGQRHGKPIIVNRQLLIANAFEEMIQDISPKIHHHIRKFYDQYGYNLSRKINTPFLANLTYILMKPLEWFFIVCLYLICPKPEQKIKKQYAA
jgi:hypothetical protein